MIIVGKKTGDYWFEVDLLTEPDRPDEVMLFANIEMALDYLELDFESYTSEELREYGYLLFQSRPLDAYHDNFNPGPDGIDREMFDDILAALDDPGDEHSDHEKIEAIYHILGVKEPERKRSE